MSQGADWPRQVGRHRADEAARWRSRRSSAYALRLVVLLVPVAVSVVASFIVTRLVPAPQDMAPRMLWLSGVVLACGLLAWPTRRQLRRLLPLAALLELSILFPGEAPARWRVAREAGSIKHLELLADGLPDSAPTQAATTILALVASLARHDRITRGHSERVRVFTDMIAEELGLSRADRDRLRWAALIHDVGKLDVPAKLLRKPGRPTASEWLSLRSHPEVGERLTAPLASWLGEHAVVVRQHHEKYDGSGYPDGLRGDQISIGARIVGLADAFEVMTAARPYKKASSRASALREVVRCSGSHFDPDVVRAFLAVSTPRLRRALGPASWIGQLPVVGTAPVGGLPVVATSVVRGAGTVMLGGMATAVVATSAAPVAVAGTVTTHQDAGQPPGAAGTVAHPGRGDSTTSPGSGTPRQSPSGAASPSMLPPAAPPSVGASVSAGESASAPAVGAGSNGAGRSGAHGVGPSGDQGQASAPKAPPTTVPSGPPVAVPSGPPAAVPSGPPVAVPSGPPVAVPSGPLAAVPSGPLAAVPSGPLAAVPSGPPVAVPNEAPSVPAPGDGVQAPAQRSGQADGAGDAGSGAVLAPAAPRAGG